MNTSEDVRVESVALEEYRAEKHKGDYAPNRSRERTMKNFIFTRKSLIISICVMMMLISGFFGVVGVASAGNTYYVSLDGDDSYPGNETHPWKTIQKAADTLIAGDTVYIKAGTYNERVIPKNSGSPGNYITYTAYPGDTATIDGTGIPMGDWGSLFEIANKDYIKVSRFRIINSGYFGIFIYKSNHIIVEKNYFYKEWKEAIAGQIGNNIIIDGNEIDTCNTKACGASAWTSVIGLNDIDTFEIKNTHMYNSCGEGINVGRGCSNGKVYKNHVHDMPFSAPVIYIDSPSNVDIYENLVHDCKSSGIILAAEVGDSLHNISVYNNIVYNTSCGIGLSSYDELVTNIKIINNICYNNRNEGVFTGNVHVEGDCVIRNNICSQNGKQIISRYPEEWAIDHNLIDGSTSVQGSNAVIGDPKFVNPSEADFHLQSDSPAIDNGSSVDAPSFDFDGNSRPQGDGYDIGAYEFVVAGATGTISGTVIDKDMGLGIEGATVTANGYSDPDGTDNNGDYIIPNVPVGTSYTVTVSKTDYFSQSQENVEVLENQTTKVNFTLTEAPDLIGEWHFDEGSGTTAHDSSEYGNNGTLTNMDPATDWVDGKIGDYALDFDGTNDYVDCGNDLPLNITEAITIMIWIKPAVAGEGGQNAGPVCKAESGVDWSWQLRYNAPGDGNYMGFQFNGDPEGSTWVSVKQNLSPGEWYHIAGTFDGTDVKCYLNGVEKDTNQISAIKGGSSTLFIGQDGWNSIFNGVIDEVKIYNRALSEEEIKADYETGLEDVTPPETTLTSGPDGTITYNDVTFNWTGSDDVTPTSQLVYSYKLEKYDSGWSAWTSVTSKSYNDLPNDNYTFKVKAKDEADKEDPTPAERSFTVLVDLSPNGSIFGTITYTCNETGIAEATVNLTRVTDGTLIASTTTESSGNYTFTDVSSGDYNLTASKIRFWSNSTSVTVNADTSTIINLMLWLKGDLNNDGTSAGIEDVAMMNSAWKDEIPKDYRYDLNNDGTPADIGDRAMMESAWEGEIVLM